MHRVCPHILILVVACSGRSPAPAASATEPGSPLPPGHPAAEARPAANQLPPGHPPTGTGEVQPSATAPGPNAAGGLAWKVPEAFVARAPKSRMRAAEYGVSAEGGAGELTVFYFGPGQGGGVQANMDRWIGQFSQPDGSDSKRAAQVDERTVAGMKVTTLDLKGTFSGGMAPMMQKAAPAPQTDHRLLGAIAEGPRGPVFFKLVGPAATLEAVRAQFEQLVGSLHPAG